MLGEGRLRADIRDAAATTSRCVGSDKVASRSGDRPAMHAPPTSLRTFNSEAAAFAASKLR